MNPLVVIATASLATSAFAVRQTAEKRTNHVSAT
jgi:hypothetical protein